LFLAIAAAQGLHIAALYTPGLSDVLAAQPVSLMEWLLVLSLALSLLAVMELWKALPGRRSQRKSDQT
ncbi:MAG TPA: hypothetical protein EYH07_03615, partial [Kiloniellaceae bacterium]|nr:hypothetical protein [Kiloniellaceae bacterium]